MSWKELRDPIHGWIRLSIDEARLLDDDVFVQRLRRITQDGLAHYVYPSARGSRFEHSLGTMYLATLMVERVLSEANEQSLRSLMDALGLHDEGVSAIRQYVRLSGLHHDIGHPPLSHVLDGYVSSLVKPNQVLYTAGLGKEHEVAGLMIMGSGKFRRIISSLGIDAGILRVITFYRLIKRVRLITQYGSVNLEASIPEVKLLSNMSDDETMLLESLASIVSGGIDADRLDYTLRDLYFTGAGSGSGAIDIARLVNYLHLGRGILIFDDKAKAFLEGYAIARYNLYKWVYMHHKVLQYDEMLREVFRSIIMLEKAKGFKTAAINFLNGNPNEDDLDIYTDDYLEAMLSEAYHEGLINGYVKDYADSILHRRTSMRALWKRDEDYIMIFGLGNAIMLNKYIDEQVGVHGLNWVNEFKTRVVNEMKETLNCDCKILVSTASFSNDISTFVRSNDGSLITITEVSPLIKAIDNAWEQTPHVFVFIDPSELSKNGVELSKVRSTAVRLLSNMATTGSSHPHYT
ncbi:HD domain-containing protein [Caldivirga maquilingensis]|uniref:Metal dependent phosphohydrolase n=1 Tax=Caldivirga maquilingensis (strain ATCC 700844 / DSM 13496 / JCM 10307 / IC-167) TaxID=397948 RepID=A8MD70_CALMQ|nr:HD domain-containing protein [Caldivirga maquilingensis]ABW01726.1 metal dependent phosphohydrolase [Caldivirga maquilingensis IC-167]